MEKELEAVIKEDSSKEATNTTTAKFFIVLIISVLSLLVWFLFFRVPKTVTTKMLESQIVEVITEKEIIDQLEKTDFAGFLSEYCGSIEQIQVSVSMPGFVKGNPTDYQKGDRYEVRDGYAYRVELPLVLYFTIQTALEEEITTDPIDITVTGSIVYCTDIKEYAFRGVEIEYGEDFDSLLNLLEIQSWFE